MTGLPSSTWWLLIASTVPWLLLSFVYVLKVKRADQKQASSEKPET